MANKIIESHMAVGPPLDHTPGDRISTNLKREHDTKLLVEMMEFLKAEQKRSATIPPGGYQINKSLEYLFDGDRRADISIAGAGPGVTSIVQADKTIPLFELGTTSGNLRGMTISGMQLAGGSRAITTHKCVYNQYKNLQFGHGRGEYAVECVNSSDRYENCWGVHTPNSFMKIINGTVVLDGCRLGEDCGGFSSHGRLILNNCHGHNLKSKSNQRAWIVLGSGAATIINGGDFGFAENWFDSIFWAKNAGDFLVNGSNFNIGNTPVFYDNFGTVQWSRIRGGPAYRHDGGRILCSAPLTYCQIDRPDRSPTHKHAKVDTTIKHSGDFEWGKEFENEPTNVISKSHDYS